MTPKKRWGEMKELFEKLRATSENTAVLSLVEHYDVLEAIRVRTYNDLQFSESVTINKAVDFECARCGAEFQITKAKGSCCECRRIEEVAKEIQCRRAGGRGVE